jgi:hypothetical protein
MLGNDFIDGGEGNDTVNYSYSKGPFSINLESGLARGSSELDNFKNLENIIGTGLDD